jgi:hypothetical protein
MNRKILLVEPDYKNKYPPMGLMKISTYHRDQGDSIRFFKGDLKKLVLDIFAEHAVSQFSKIDPETNWKIYKSDLVRIIQKNSTKGYELVFETNPYRPALLQWIKYYNGKYKRREIPDEVKWDRIYVTTLFTFYWNKIVDTINYAKSLVKEENGLFVGGIASTVAAKDLETETGIKPIKGLLDKPRMLDQDNNIIVDKLPLDYSILEEIDYIYPESDAYYGYMTRGCKRKCEFCAVPSLEPEFQSYIPTSQNVKEVERVYGPKRNLLLLDNNVLASDRFEDIVADIKRAGFYKGATYVEPNKLDLAINNLKDGINDLAYRKLSQKIILGLAKRVKGLDFNNYRKIIGELEISPKYLASKKQLLEAYTRLSVMYDKFTRQIEKARYVDFNQGIDARLMTEEKMNLLSEIPVRPLRIAFDDMHFEKQYVKSVCLAAKYGIKNLSNYLLYNYKEKPVELYQRLKINVELCEKLDISIYSFPMKYNPINDDEGFFKNRNYLGEHWNRKFIRAIQIILNSTKGKVGNGRSFFEEAFGGNEEEYFDLLYMPDEYILYRFHFKGTGHTNEWRKNFHSLTEEEKIFILPLIEEHDYKNLDFSKFSHRLKELMEHYLVTKEGKTSVSDAANY